MDNDVNFYTVNQGVEQYMMSVTKDEYMSIYKLAVKQRNKIWLLVSLIAAISGIAAMPFNKTATAAILSFGLIYIVLMLIGAQKSKKQWIKRSLSVENEQYLIDVFEDKISFSTIENNELTNRYSLNFDNITSIKENENFIIISDDSQLFFIKKSIVSSESILNNLFKKISCKYRKIANIITLNSVFYMLTSVLLLFVYTSIDTIATYTGNPSLWLYFIALIFPISLIILSFIMKKFEIKWKPTLILGIIFSVFCIVNGIGQFGYHKYYNSGYNVISETEKHIGIEIPVPEYIDFYKYSYTENNNIEIINEVCMEFGDQEYVQTDINYVEKIISDDVWMKGLPDEYLNIIPFPDYFSESEYSILYNVDTKEINTVPTESGTHRLVIIAYYYGILDIVEYSITI